MVPLFLFAHGLDLILPYIVCDTSSFCTNSYFRLTFRPPQLRRDFEGMGGGRIAVDQVEFLGKKVGTGDGYARAARRRGGARVIKGYRYLALPIGIDTGKDRGNHEDDGSRDGLDQSIAGVEPGKDDQGDSDGDQRCYPRDKVARPPIARKGNHRAHRSGRSARTCEDLDRIRNEQEKFPDQRVALEGELSLIQTRLHHLVETIANGKSTDSVIASLHQEEARRKVVVQELSRIDSLAQVVFLDAKRLAKDLRSRVGDIPTLFARAGAHNTPDAQEAPGWAYRL